jgi:hypothetical protein
MVGATSDWKVELGRFLKPFLVRMIWPVAKRGRPRQRHVADVLSIDGVIGLPACE